MQLRKHARELRKAAMVTLVFYTAIVSTAAISMIMNEHATGMTAAEAQSVEWFLSIAPILMMLWGGLYVAEATYDLAGEIPGITDKPEVDNASE